MMEIIKVGIIGLGVGQRHLEAFEANPICEVISVCDFNEDKINDMVHYWNKINSICRK